MVCGGGGHPHAVVRAAQEQVARLEQSLTLLQIRDPLTIYAALWRDEESVRIANEIASQTLLHLDQGEILAEDIVPILLLDGLLTGFPSLEGVDHAIIDEAQDYSLPTFAYLQRCLPANCKLTIVGDLRQATNPLQGLGDYASLETAFSRPVEFVHLKTSYRSSTEISEFTATIVPSNAPIESVRRSTMKPQLVSVGAPGDSVAAIAATLGQLQERSGGSDAIVCKTRAESESLFRALNPIAPVTLVTDATRDMPTGAYVLPIWLAKGLEFGTVIVYDASTASYRYDEERRALYTACSRALHTLYVCCRRALAAPAPGKLRTLRFHYGTLSPMADATRVTLRLDTRDLDTS